MPRFDRGVVNTKLEKGDIVLMGNPTQYGEILAENILVEDILKADLETLISESNLVRGKFYRITNAVSSTISLLVQGLTANTICDYAYNTANGDLVTYNISTDLASVPFSNVYVPYTGATTNVNLGEKGITSGYVAYDITPTATPTSQGTTYWDANEETIALIMNGATQHVGLDTFYNVRNSTGSTIPKGTAVRFAGTDGNSGHLLIAPMLANGTYPSTYYMGITSEAIANGDFGKVIEFGKLRSVNTSAYNDGDILYVSTSVAGGFQTTTPIAPNNIINAAAVVNAANNGTLMVRATLGSNINSDEGVKITTPTTGQLLELQSNGLWENKTKAQVLGGTSSQFVKGDGSLLNAGTANQLLGMNAGATAQEYKTLNGTTSQVVVTNASGSITLSLPQSIATTSTPQFARIGIGAAAQTAINIYSGRNLTDAANAIGISSQGQVQVDVTGTARYFSTNVSQIAGATTTSIVHYETNQSTISGTLSNQIGFAASSGMINGTNIYGFYGNISSGANKWNAYMLGTASNYFAGDTLIGTTSNPSSRKLLVNGTAEITGALTLGTALGIASGGTGLSTTPTNGQIDIGNGTGFTRAGITGTANQVTVTNGAGSITLSLPQSIATTSTPQFAKLGIGASNSLSNYIRVGGNITGNSTISVFRNEVTVQSDVTTTFNAYVSSISLQATSFTLNTLNHFIAQSGALSGGSAITTQNGFIVDTNLTGATNNYAFRGLIPSGTGRWNIYMDGSAANAFVGQTIFGSTTLVTSALVALSSTTQGFRPPVMTTAQRDAIVSPTAGLMIYNTTTNKLNVYTTAWEAITSA